MKKARKIVCIAAVVCLLLGIGLVAAGFFTGGSPVTVVNHGCLKEYFVRLNTNWHIFVEDVYSLF